MAAGYVTFEDLGPLNVQVVVNEVERWLITNYYTRFDAKEYLQEHVPRKIIQSYFIHTVLAVP
jgi:hypothetical protein